MHRVHEPNVAPAVRIQAGSAAFLAMHCASVAHAAHMCIVRLQMGVVAVPEQLASEVHGTQVPTPAPVRMHAGVVVLFARHSALLAHPAHMCVAIVQMGAAAVVQWALVVHGTQVPVPVPVPVMHAGNAAFLPRHCASAMHWPQACVVAVAQMGVAVGQTASARHCTQVPVPTRHSGCALLLLAH